VSLSTLEIIQPLRPWYNSCMTKLKVTPARGFRDHPPNAKVRRESLLADVRAVYGSFGFREIETPVVEPLERLRDSEGGENVGMIFEILRRGLSPDDISSASSGHALCDLGLRYDLTVPLARFFASERDNLPRVARTIQVGPVWRAERPQRGRFRQFTQCDIDVLGEPGVVAEIELIVATILTIRRIGLNGAVVRLNDRRLLKGMLDDAGVPESLQSRALVVIDKLDKIGLDGVASQLRSLPIGDAASSLVEGIASFANANTDVETFARTIGASVSPSAAADHRAIISGVRQICGASAIRFDPTLVRGLGYYTGPIFEIDHPESGVSLGGGGRYDGMIGRFLGQDVPACGFSLGFDRILELLGDTEASEDPMRLALIYPADADPHEVVARQVELIGRGYKVALTQEARNMRRVFEDLRSAGYQRFQTLAAAPDDVRAVPDSGSNRNRSSRPRSVAAADDPSGL
jgi:histidyl-tRNA synthetase